MNIKIDLVISATPELLNALLGLVGKPPAAMPVVDITENGEEKKGRKKKVETPVVSMEKTADEIETKDAVKEEVKTDLTQEMIIADAVPKSKAGHKDKIKAKVTELGYESITDLLPVHFDEFYAFLQTIPKPA